MRRLKMSLRRWIVSPFLLLFVLSIVAYAQEEKPDFVSANKWSIGLGFEYFKRTISWDEDSLVSPLKSYFLTFHLHYEILEGLNLGAMIGYAPSDYESLVFRELPVSLELDEGSIGGLLFGGEATFSFYRTAHFDFAVIGQYVYNSGGEKQWDIPGLAVQGTATGKPKWSRAVVGASFKFLGSEPLFPCVSVAYSPLWGTYTMEESIQTLSGTEEKKISSKGKFMISGGGIYDFSDSFNIKLEANVVPYGSGDTYDGGVDLGVALRIMYSF